MRDLFIFFFNKIYFTILVAVSSCLNTLLSNWILQLVFARCVFSLFIFHLLLCSKTPLSSLHTCIRRVQKFSLFICSARTISAIASDFRVKNIFIHNHCDLLHSVLHCIVFCLFRCGSFFVCCFVTRVLLLHQSMEHLNKLDCNWNCALFNNLKNWKKNIHTN